MIATPPRAVATGVAAEGWYRTLLATVAGMITDALTPLLQPRTITLWYVLDGGGVALTAGTYVEVPIDFPFVITGWRLLSRATGAIVLDVGRATAAAYPTFTSIVAAAPPTLAAFQALSDTIPGWTTQINGTNVLSVSVTSNAGALTKVSFGLRARVLSTTLR